MRTDIWKSGIAGLIVATLVACGTPMQNSSYDNQYGTQPAAANNVNGYGTVQAIDVVPRQSSGIGLGTVAGAVVGGVLGNQIGGGSGRTAATVAGAAGGALAGNQIQKNMNSGNANVYRVTVRMDNGSTQALVQETQPNLRIGERVHIENGAIVERLD